MTKTALARAMGVAGVSIAAAIIAACNGSSSGNSSSSGGGSTGPTGPTTLTGTLAYTSAPTNNPNAAYVIPATGTSSSQASKIADLVNAPGGLVVDSQTVASGKATGETHIGFMFNGYQTLSESASRHWYGVHYATNGSPTITQLSADTLTNPPCNLGLTTFGGNTASFDVNPVVVYRDLKDGSSAFALYTDAGPDLGCGDADDVTYAVNFSGSATANAVALPGAPVAAIYNADGTLGGLLVFQYSSTTLQNGLGNLVWVSDTSTFAVASTVMPNVLYLSVVLNDASNTLLHGGQAFLQLGSQFGATPTLYRFSAAGVLSQVSQFSTPYTSSTNSVSSIADDTTLYYVDGEVLTSVRLDGSSEPLAVASLPNAGYTIVGLTSDNVLLSYQGTLSVTPRTGSVASSPTTLPTAVQGLPLKYVSSQYLFFNPSPANPTIQALLTDENGTVLDTFANTAWLGSRYTPDASGVLPQKTLASVVVAVAPSGGAAFTGTSQDNNAIAFTGATLGDLNLDGTVTNFTDASGAAETFSFTALTTYAAGAFTLHTDVLADIGTFAPVDSVNTEAYKFDFINHFLTQLTSDQTGTKAPISN